MTDSSNFYVDLDELFGLKPQLPPPSYESFIEQRIKRNEEEINKIQNYLNNNIYEKRETTEEIKEEIKDDIKEEMKVEYWECKLCTYYNKLDNIKCEICENSKNALQEYLKRNTENEKQYVEYWVCNVCTLHNSLNKDKCDVCETQNFSIILSKNYNKEKQEQKTEQKQEQLQEEQKKIKIKKKCFTSHCNSCESKFTLFNRKYTCHKCKYFFCDDCSSKKITIILNGEPERVCDECYKSLTSLSYIFNRIVKN
jgi:hypothetical protein